MQKIKHFPLLKLSIVFLIFSRSILASADANVTVPPADSSYNADSRILSIQADNNECKIYYQNRFGQCHFAKWTCKTNNADNMLRLAILAHITGADVTVYIDTPGSGSFGQPGDPLRRIEIGRSRPLKKSRKEVVDLDSEGFDLKTCLHRKPEP